MNETPHFSFSAPFHGRELVIDFAPATRLVSAGLDRDWLTSEITWGPGRGWIVHVMENGRLDDAMIENPASVIAEELNMDYADVIDEIYALVDVAPDPDNPARLLIERAAAADRNSKATTGSGQPFRQSAIKHSIAIRSTMLRRASRNLGSAPLNCYKYCGFKALGESR